MANKVKGIPDGAPVVIPGLVCRDPAGMIEFCTSTFGAGIMDPSGHVWMIATRIEETTEEERKDRWSSIQPK